MPNGDVTQLTVKHFPSQNTPGERQKPAWAEVEKESRTPVNALCTLFFYNSVQCFMILGFCCFLQVHI